MIVDYSPQRTTEWLRMRLGVLTASQVDQLLTPSGKLSTQRQKLLHRLVAESLIGDPVDEFAGTYWTNRGEELEQEAVAFFEMQTDLQHTPVGFVWRDESKTCGCSPDGLVRQGGDFSAGVEIKCPRADTHVGYLLADDKDPYIQQVQFSLWVTGLPLWYFLSYHPLLPPVLREYRPDSVWQSAYSNAVPVFLAELNAAMSRLDNGKRTDA